MTRIRLLSAAAFAVALLLCPRAAAQPTEPQRPRLADRAKVAVASPERGDVELVVDSDITHLVLQVEFDSADRCRDFNVNGVHVFNRLDEFADVMVSPKDEKALQAI